MTLLLATCLVLLIVVAYLARPLRRRAAASDAPYWRSQHAAPHAGEADASAAPPPVGALQPAGDQLALDSIRALAAPPHPRDAASPARVLYEHLVPPLTSLADYYVTAAQLHQYGEPGADAKALLYRNFLEMEHNLLDVSISLKNIAAGAAPGSDEAEWAQRSESAVYGLLRSARLLGAELGFE